jgi:hypothetical protein
MKETDGKEDDGRDLQASYPVVTEATPNIFLSFPH